MGYTTDNLDEDLTAVETVKGGMRHPATVYNLKGQRVGATAHGVVIADGQQRLQ